MGPGTGGTGHSMLQLLLYLYAGTVCLCKDSAVSAMMDTR